MHYLQDPVTYLIPIFGVLIFAEMYISYRNNLHLFKLADSVASVSLGIGSVFINLVMKALAFIWFSYVHQYALFDIGWQWWAWIILLFADDFTFYWHHRLSHEIRFFWAAHINHHSSQYYNFATALRQSWTEIIYKYFWWTWLPLLGFEPLMVFMMISVSLIYQFLLHTEVVGNMGFLERFMNTPSHHRVHHATNIKYLDRNHGAIFIIWDKLFGTFEPEDPNEKPVYGITVNLETHNVLVIASHEWVNLWRDMKTADTWMNTLKYAIYPPGWTHTGVNNTSKYLQQQYYKQQQQQQQ